MKKDAFMTVGELLKTEKIIKIPPDNHLSQTLASLSSSHDAAFVFDKKDNFLGIINPYYTVIKNNHPGTTKVKHILFHPPKLKLTDSVKRAVQLMIESKIHYLPVFNNQQDFIGIISARRVLKNIISVKELNISLSQILVDKKALIVLYEEDNLIKALNLFKNHKISKLVVIGKDLKLRGILAYYDLIPNLTIPRERLASGDKHGTKEPFLNFKVNNFMKSLVLTLKSEDRMDHVARLIIERKIGSVVVVDNENHPIGIITTKDVLSHLFQTKEQSSVDVFIKNLSKENQEKVYIFFSHLKKNLVKKHKRGEIKFLAIEEKNGRLFKIKVDLKVNKKKETIIREGKNLTKVLKSIKNAFQSIIS